MHRSLWKDVAESSPLLSSGLANYRILLLGPVASGKSSFFNSVFSTMRGFVSQQATSSHGSCTICATTKTYREYDVMSPLSGRPMGWRVGDTTGLQRNGQGIDVLELLRLVDGCAPDRWQSYPDLGHTRMGSTADYGQRAHCCALVISAPAVNSMTNEMWGKLNIIQRAVAARGIPVVILLTKIDTVCASVKANPLNVFHSQPVKDIVKIINFSMPNVPLNRIFPVKNYINEPLIHENVSTLILLAFREMLRLSDKYLVSHQPPVAQGNSKKSGQSLKEMFLDIAQSRKYWIALLVLIVACFFIYLCLHYEVVKNTVVYREGATMVFTRLLGRACFVSGWITDCAIIDDYDEYSDSLF